MASLLVHCITAFWGKKLQNKASKYQMQIAPQETVPPNVYMPENLQVYFLSKNLVDLSFTLRILENLYLHNLLINF